MTLAKEGVEAVAKSASEAGADDLVSCDAVCFGTSGYFSYLAGLLRVFFYRTFYPTQRQVDDKPYGVFVTHGGGGSASASVEKLCRSFRFTHVAQTVLVRERLDEAAQVRLRELGEALAKSVL